MIPDKDILVTVALMMLHMLLLGIVQVAVPIYALANNVSNVGLGIVVGASGLSGLLMAIPGSVLSDHLGRRVSFIGSFGLWLSAGIVMVRAPSTFTLAIGQVLVGAADLLIFISGVAQLIELSTEENYGHVMSISSGMMGSGLIAGPVIAGLIIRKLGYSYPFLLLTILGGLGALYSLRIRETRGMMRKPINILENLRTSYRQSLELTSSNLSVRLVVLISAVGTLSWMSVAPSFYVSYLGEIGCSVDCIGILAGLRAGAGVVGRFSFSYFAKFVGPIPVSLWGFGLAGLALAITPSLQSIPLLASIGCFGEALDRMRLPGIHTILAHGTNRESRTLGIALSTMAWAFVSMVAPPIWGVVVDLWELDAAFIVPGVIVFLSAIIMRIFARKYKQ